MHFLVFSVHFYAFPMEKVINPQTLLDLIRMEQVMIVYLIGIFVGVFFIAYAPYARKKKDSDMEWNHYYTAIFLMSMIVAVFAAASEIGRASCRERV